MSSKFLNILNSKISIKKNTLKISYPPLDDNKTYQILVEPNAILDENNNDLSESINNLNIQYTTGTNSKSYIIDFSKYKSKEELINYVESLPILIDHNINDCSIFEIKSDGIKMKRGAINNPMSFNDTKILLFDCTNLKSVDCLFYIDNKPNQQFAINIASNLTINTYNGGSHFKCFIVAIDWINNRRELWLNNSLRSSAIPYMGTTYHYINDDVSSIAANHKYLILDDYASHTADNYWKFLKLTYN